MKMAEFWPGRQVGAVTSNEDVVTHAQPHPCFLCDLSATNFFEIGKNPMTGLPRRHWFRQKLQNFRTQICIWAHRASSRATRLFLTKVQIQTWIWFTCWIRGMMTVTLTGHSSTPAEQRLGLTMWIQTDEEESDALVAKYESSNSYPGLTPRCLYTINKSTLCLPNTLKNWTNDFKWSLKTYLKVVFSSWKNLFSNMIITTCNPSYLKLLGPGVYSRSTQMSLQTHVCLYSCDRT